MGNSFMNCVHTKMKMVKLFSSYGNKGLVSVIEELRFENGSAW